MSARGESLDGSGTEIRIEGMSWALRTESAAQHVSLVIDADGYADGLVNDLRAHGFSAAQVNASIYDARPVTIITASRAT